MAFRYTNAGDGADLLVSVTALDVDKTKSLTGKAFYQTQQVKCFDLPATNEVWMKFDVYFDGTNRWRAYNHGSNSYSGITTQTNGQLEFYSNGSRKNYFSGICIANKRQTVLLHMTAGSSDGVIEAWVDGTLIYSYTGDVNHGEDFAELYLQSDGAGTLFSNIIVSDSEIHTYEGANSSSFDVETHIYNGLRGWRYFNPGDADLLATGGTTQKVTADKSVTGIAFNNTTTSDLFNTPAGFKEVYMRFDFWCPSLYSTTRYFQAGCWSSSRSTIIGMHCNSNSSVCYLRDGSDYRGSLYQNLEQLNHVLLHIKSDATDGLVEFTLNGKTISWRGNVNDGNDLDRLGMREAGSFGVLFSNIIVSESAIDLNAGYHRQLIPTETAVTAPMLNVRWQGANHQFYPTTKRTTPALTLRVGDKNFYAPIVNDSDALASAVRLLLDDTNRALKT